MVKINLEYTYCLCFSCYKFVKDPIIDIVTRSTEIGKVREAILKVLLNSPELKCIFTSNDKQVLFFSCKNCGAVLGFDILDIFKEESD